MSRKAKIPLIFSLIAHVRLLAHAFRLCGDYSAGNKRKLSVAIALIGNPELLFLDGTRVTRTRSIDAY